jgi:hypothetical protein
VGEETRGAAGGAEEEHRRNLERNTRLLRLFAELVAKNDKEYWMAYLNFINEFYHHVWQRFEEDPSSGKPT